MCAAPALLLLRFCPASSLAAFSGSDRTGRSNPVREVKTHVRANHSVGSAGTGGAVLSANCGNQQAGAGSVGVGPTLGSADASRPRRLFVVLSRAAAGRSGLGARRLPAPQGDPARADGPAF